MLITTKLGVPLDVDHVLVADILLVDLLLCVPLQTCRDVHVLILSFETFSKLRSKLR